MLQTIICDSIQYFILLSFNNFTSKICERLRLLSLPLTSKLMQKYLRYRSIKVTAWMTLSFDLEKPIAKVRINTHKKKWNRNCRLNSGESVKTKKLVVRFVISLPSFYKRASWLSSAYPKTLDKNRSSIKPPSTSSMKTVS